MNIDPLIDDFIINKTKIFLPYNEREEIISEILLAQKELPSTAKKIDEEILYKLDDPELVYVLMHAYEYTTIKYFNQINKKPENFFY